MKFGALFGAGLAGVFVGAMATEMIHRVNPNLLKDFSENTKKTLRDMSSAFKEGYRTLPAKEKSEG
jgi:predicted naringenin-chalcone synthase